MKEIVLESKYLCDMEKSHDYLMKKLDFPDYYGKNLDALYDCLTDLRDVSIVINMSEEKSYYQKKILRVFQDAHEAGMPLTIIENLN